LTLLDIKRIVNVIFRPQRKNTSLYSFLWWWFNNGAIMAKILKTSAENRKCQFPNCENTLSIYNHETYCHIHRDNLPMEGKLRSLINPAKSH